MMKLFEKFWATQLAKPSGIFGRLFMAGKLDRLNQWMNDLTYEQLDLKDGDQLLEIGFGGGALLQKVLSSSTAIKVTGIDISQPMLKVAQRRFRDAINEGHLSLIFGGIEQIPSDAGTFSKVCTVNTIYFLKDPISAFKECHRVLKADGALIICFNPKEELEQWSGHQYGFMLYTLEQVMDLVTQAGFLSVQSTKAVDPVQGSFYCVKAYK